VGLKAIISDGKIASKASQETTAAHPSAKSPYEMLQEILCISKRFALFSGKQLFYRYR